MAPGTRYQRAPGWVWRAFRGSVLVMGPDLDALQLEGAAAVVWAALDRPATVTELVDRGGDVWAGAGGEPAVLADVALEELVAAGMVTTAHGSA